jgi:enoyl-CoA hydratase/carnithine racemase
LSSPSAADRRGGCDPAAGAVSHVEYDVRDGIAFITLNRPEVRNALSDDVIRELGALLVRADEDEQVQVAILSGRGKAFSSGADVKQRQLRPAEELRRLGGPEDRNARVDGLPYRYANFKPLIAAVHGHVMGAALYLALMSEMIVAAERTQFQITEVVRGTDGTKYMLLLAERSGLGFATDVAITGRFWTAEEGRAVGAVDRLTAPGAQLEAAVELARTIMALPPLAVRAIVEARRGVNEAIELQGRLRRPRSLHLSEDFRESATAFMEKRAPVYRGR